jgi:hypothetical protein
MLVRGDPPPELPEILSRSAATVEHAQIVREGVHVRLRAWLPAYLALRRALLDAHCPLLLPLVSSYEEPTTTEELRATGLSSL